MRLTINLDSDLYAMARAHAVAKRTSISKAIGDLLRSRHAVHWEAEVEDRTHPLSGFPISRGDAERFTSEDVRRAEAEEETRHWSSAKRQPPRHRE